MNEIGCLIVAYQRPLELQTILDLVDAEKFDRVFIVIDRPKVRTKESLERFDCVTQVALNFSSSREYVKVNIRPTNYGIIKNFQDAIEECFQYVDQLCILEDDCIPSTGIRNYLDAVLTIPLDRRIKMISLTRPSTFDETGNFELTHVPLMWGWVVSQQNWNLISSLMSKKRRSGLFPFPRIIFQSFLYSGYYRARNNQFDALDALIAYVFSSQDFLTLVPPRNLVSNVGTGPIATNTMLGSPFLHAAIAPWESSFMRKSPRINTARILLNDFLIFSKMNGWKIHHLFSNYLKIRFLSK